jgi:hypothetical protein
MKTLLPAASLLASALLLAACAGQETTPSGASVSATLGLPEPLAPPGIDQAALAPADAFLAALASHCGQAFAGKVRVDVPETPDNAFAGKPMVMHVRECREGEVRVPFHVGDDHSRTWVITRTASGLRLKHDHRHEDGSPDESTMYGGDTAQAGTAIRQEFPVDAESVAMFGRLGMTASVTNTWAIEIVPGEQFVYELSRPGGRLFQVEFDLSKPVPAPPAPWGATAAAD